MYKWSEVNRTNEKVKEWRDGCTNEMGMLSDGDIEIWMSIYIGGC